MFLVPCPHCGPRNASEFRHQGEHGGRPDPATATPWEWRAYLYEHDNVAGWTTETWYHASGCRRYISVQRHSVTNETRAADVPVGVVAPTEPSVDSGAPDADSTRPSGA